MSIEDQIRDKQNFEYNLKLYLKLALALTNNEIEIVLGRLADMLTNTKSDSRRKSIKFTGDVLKFYYDLRISGERKQSKAQRISINVKSGVYIDGGFRERLISELANSILDPPTLNFQEHYKSESHFRDTIKLLAP